MDRKHHWAYPALTRPGLTRPQLLTHFRHEYLVYVRDFPVLLARLLGVTPPRVDVRSALAVNLYEEQTGGLSRTEAHPELFLRMMAGLGFDRPSFADDVGLESTDRPRSPRPDAGDDTPTEGARSLAPAARRYRDFLFERSCAAPWQAGLALLTVFVEGSVNERAELAGTFVRRSGEDAIREHPLVKHYGCPPVAMDLARAHAQVEGGHREDAWRLIVAHVPESGPVTRTVVDTCEEALSLWLAYRDAVAERMGIERQAA
jgi:pyrroloquinoline quinone (PQQ) biosynthesis protein C